MSDTNEEFYGLDFSGFLFKDGLGKQNTNSRL